MSTPDITAGDVMDAAASLMNDTAKSVYTYVKQLPYLQMALGDLRKLLQLNNSPVTDETSAVIEVAAGIDTIQFSDTDPTLPHDLIEIQQVWESPSGQNSWTKVDRKEFLPHYFEGSEISQFLIYQWAANEIHLLPANANNDLKLDYIRNLFAAVVDENSNLLVINCDSYLQYRTAALLGEFVGENPTRALALNIQATEAFDIMSGIDNKGKQAIVTRRRPFRAGWKRRGTV